MYLGDWLVLNILIIFLKYSIWKLKKLKFDQETIVIHYYVNICLKNYLKYVMFLKAFNKYE
jgi:hypothetical protein